MNTQLLQYTVESGTDTKSGTTQTVVLLHGFPDNPAMWEQTSLHLQQSGFRVVRIALPEFESMQVTASTNDGPHTLDETVERLHATLAHAQALGSTLIGHDWGAIFIYMLLNKYPDAASRFIALEIGAAPRSISLTLFVFTYHCMLNIAHWLGSGLGDKLVQWLCAFFPRPRYKEALKPKAKHAWVYRQAWREGAKYGPWPFYYRNVIAQWNPPASLPFLFLYGQDGLKILRFHSKTWRQNITASCPQSRAKGIDGKHWFFLEHPESFEKELDTFLAATASKPNER